MTVSRKVDYVADSKSVGGRFESFAAHHFRAPSSRPTPSTARPRRVGRSCAPSAGSASSCRRRAGGVGPGSPRRHGGERRRGGEAVEAGGAGGGPSSRNFLWISPARSITWRRTEFWRRTRTRAAECAAAEHGQGRGGATRRWAPSRIPPAGGVSRSDE